MTRTTAAQYRKNHVVATVLDTNMTPIPAADLVRQAQRDSAQDVARAIISGVQWIGNQVTKIRHAVADVTAPPTAAA